MPVNLIRPSRSREAQPTVLAPALDSVSRRTGRIVYHPRYERFLRRCGIDSASAALALPGEVICGHPDRHVARVELRAGSSRRVVYLKREHLIGLRTRLRNRLAGFGMVSRSEREAATLQRLEEAALPGPQWLAYGEDGRGRAFLLVDELGGMADLRDALADTALSPAERRLLAERAGHAVAEWHDAGFGTPELAAKHLFVDPRTPAVSLVDWQSAGPPAPVPDADRARQLAGLHASLADALASPRERLRFAWAYQRNRPSLRFRTLVRDVLAHAARRQHRSSVRDQRHASAGRLVWLAGEAVCVVPEMAEVWPTPAIGPPFYPTAAAPESGEEWITFPDGRRALLVRFTSFDPLGRLVAALSEKPWRSPAATAGRALFHLRRYGVPAPALLAFGQRFTSPARAESFVLYSPPAGAVPVAARLAQLTPDARAALLRDCGRVLRSLHDAGCRVVPGDRPALVAGDSGVSIESPFAVRLVKRLTSAARRADLRMLLRGELSGGSAAVTLGYDAHP